MIENLIHTIKNFDLKIKKIMTNGLYFSLFVSIIATIILIYYISFSHYNFIYYIGIEIMKLSFTFGSAFFASALAIDTIKKDLE